MNDFALKWLILVQFLPFQWISPTSAAFTFTLNVVSHESHGCALSDICETRFSNFCLRGPRTGTPSLDNTDCPLGTNDLVLNGPSGSRTITSDQPWPAGFQLLFRGLNAFGESNTGGTAIVVDLSLEVNSTSPVGTYSNNGGTISISLQMNFMVTCSPGFTGSDCTGIIETLSGGIEPPACFLIIDPHPCDAQPCQNGGVCIHNCNNFQCDCPAGFNGQDCSQAVTDPCLGANCPGNSTCTTTTGNTSHECACNPGYTGDDCDEVIPCFGVNCPGNSMCVSTENSHKCVCDDGYTGEKCDKMNPCFGVNCPSNSACSPSPDNPSQHMCVCNDGFTGENCTKTEADPKRPWWPRVLILLGIILLAALLIVLMFSVTYALYRRSKKSHQRLQSAEQEEEETL